MNVLFKVGETLGGSEGTINSQGVEVIARKESDGNWLVLQERIRSDDEMMHDSGRLQ